MSGLSRPILETRTVRDNRGNQRKIFVEILPNGSVNWNLRLIAGAITGFVNPMVRQKIFEIYENWKGRPPAVSQFVEKYRQESLAFREPGKAESADHAGQPQTRRFTPSFSVSDRNAIPDFIKHRWAVEENKKRKGGVFYKPGNLVSPNGFFYTTGGTCEHPFSDTVLPGFNDISDEFVTLDIRRTANLDSVTRELRRLGAVDVEFRRTAPCRRNSQTGLPVLSPIDYVEALVRVRPGDALRFAGVCGINLARAIQPGDVPICNNVSPSYLESMRSHFSAASEN